MTQVNAWPKMMKRSTAAAYLDISEVSFAKEIAAGRMPTSIILGGREHWRRDAIDAAIDALNRPTQPQEPDHIRRFKERIARAKGEAA